MAMCCRILIPLCLLATITSTLQVYPHQLTYFNETDFNAIIRRIQGETNNTVFVHVHVSGIRVQC